MELIRLVPQGHKPRACLERVYLVFSGHLQKYKELMILRVINLFWFWLVFFFPFQTKLKFPRDVSELCPMSPLRYGLHEGRRMLERIPDIIQFRRALYSH